MSVIGVFDYDFMNYAPVIPNLECAKLCAYYKNKKEITILAPELDPSRYTNFIIRKDYDDEKYDRKFFEKNVEYGGLAFSKNQYRHLPIDIESTIPDFEVYEKYKAKFGSTKTAQGNFTKLLNGAHARLSLDGKTLWEDYQKPIELQHRTNSIFFHDYDLNAIPGSIDVIKDLASRYTRKKGEFDPRVIGMKFPTQINDDESFHKWFDIAPSFSLFFLQYNGVMRDDSIVELCEKNLSIAKQFYYNVGSASYSEEEFVKKYLPQIFRQVLFLRRKNIKISLKYDEDFFVDQRLKNLIRLFNNYLGREKLAEGSKPFAGTLYKFVSSKKMKQYQFSPTSMKLPDIRNCFQYVREKNYEVFEMFYSQEEVEYKGGELLCLKRD